MIKIIIGYSNSKFYQSPDFVLPDIRTYIRKSFRVINVNNYKNKLKIKDLPDRCGP